MKLRARSVLFAVVYSCVGILPATAGIAPYVRVDFGANKLDLPAVDQQVRDEEAQFYDSGLLVDFDDVGFATGFSGSAGLWLLPGLRVGAVWSDARSKLENRVDLSGFEYADDFRFHMKDVGVEAAVRIRRLGGLTLGGNLGRSNADMSERYTLRNVHGDYLEAETAGQTGRTYGGFVGFDQTNPAGIAGYVRLGFQHRDLGAVPTVVSVTSNGATTVGPGAPFSLDYTGYYFRVGVGFDLRR